MNSLKDVYKNKNIPKNKIVESIVEKQAAAFSNAIDDVFAVEWDTPDYVLREKLKQNVWNFSSAKNYNDLIRLNNLLLDGTGALRTWNDFKREAQAVVGTSVRHLKTEYNTIVASTQMARLWAEIQRDKHIFPFIQFVVVKDDHTSDICAPLHNVIVRVDDPMLLVFFPPNHFNCRTTVKKLRRGVPTQNFSVPDIPEAFRNNPAITGKIFTDTNSYIANTPNAVLITTKQLFYDNKFNKRYEGIIFTKVPIQGSGQLEVFTNGKQNKVEFAKNKSALTVLAEDGMKYRMLPIINDGLSNPDAFNILLNHFVDVKVVTTENGKSALQNGLKEASKQRASELILRLTKEPKSYRDMYRVLIESITKNRNKNVHFITTILPNNSIRQYDLQLIKKRLKDKGKTNI